VAHADGLVDPDRASSTLVSNLDSDSMSERRMRRDVFMLKIYYSGKLINNPEYEFYSIMQYGGDDLKKYDFDEPNNTPLIPNSLHMIWVGDNDAPAFFHEHVSAWRELMPDWTIRIWTNHDIREKNFEPDVLSQIKKATSGAQKADLMRYSIIERYGGVYMDADMIPRRALDPILCLGELVLCHDIPITWAYISNGFFAAIPHHPVLHTAVRLSKTAVLNTHHINMGTGPRLFGEAIGTTPPGINRYINLPSVYLIGSYENLEKKSCGYSELVTLFREFGNIF
jgi:mannosyltransferase OCH1-like enzyme